MRFLSGNTHPISIYITRTLFYFVLCNGQKLDEDIVYQPESVSRRSSHDIIYQDQWTHSRCTLDTYVIEENRCVKNDNFFASKLAILCTLTKILFKCTECRSFAFTPSGEPTVKRLAISLDRGNQSMTHDSMKMPAIASIVSNSNARVNDSLCQIANLEVYRGKTQTTEISHAGFILSNEGIFEVKSLFRILT